MVAEVTHVICHTGLIEFDFSAIFEYFVNHADIAGELKGAAPLSGRGKTAPEEYTFVAWLCLGGIASDVSLFMVDDRK